MAIQRICALFGVLLASCSPQYDWVSTGDTVVPPQPPHCDFTPVDGGPFSSYDCNPVLTTQGEPWAPSVLSASVVVREVQGHPQFHLFYIGAPHPKDVLGDYGLGHAVSDNGAEWRVSPNNPLLTEPLPSDWDAHNMENIQVIWDPSAGQYVMIYLGYNLTGWHTFGLGVATSPDGEQWERSADNPVVDVYQYFESDPEWRWPTDFWRDGDGRYRGFAAGASTEGIGRSLYPIGSDELTDWSMDTSPILQTGGVDTFDQLAVLSSSIVEMDGVYYMFYVGVAKTEDYMTTWVYGGDLGVATSVDGTHWVKGFFPEAEVDGEDSEPVQLRAEPTGAISHVDAHRVGDVIHLWVTDTWDDKASIGYYIFDPEQVRSP